MAEGFTPPTVDDWYTPSAAGPIPHPDTVIPKLPTTGTVPLPASSDPAKATDWLNPAELSASTGWEAPIRETGEGVSSYLRAGMGMKMTPEGGASFLEHYYGKGNVVTDEAGATFFRPSHDAPFEPVRGKGLNWGDVAEYVPKTALEAGPVMAAGTNPLTVGAAGVAGNLARQNFSYLLPGDDQMSAEERGLSLGEAGVLAGASQGLLNRGMGMVDYLRPGNIIRRNIQAAADTPYSAGAQTVEQEVGLPLSIGEATGSRLGLLMEGMARRYAPSMDMMNRFDRDRMLGMQQRVQGLIDTADKTGWGPEELGNNVAKTFTGAVDNALNVRRSAATRDFGNLSAVDPTRGVIRPNNVLGTIDNLINDFAVPGGGDAAATLVNRLRTLRDSFGEPGTPPRALTGQEVNRLLQIYGNAASGSGRIFQDIDTAQQRYIARQFTDALGKDLDDAVTSGGQPANVANALRTARDNYRGNSAAINQLEEMTLGRLLGRQSQTPPVPEDITNAMKNMKPSQMRATMAVLETRNPAIRGSLQAQFLNDALDAATKGGESPTEAAIPGAPEMPRFSYKKFVDALPSARVRDEVFGATPTVQRDLTQIARWMGYASEQEGVGSPTAPLNWMMDATKQVFHLKFPEALQSIVAGIGVRRMARYMTTPEGRESIINLTDNRGITGPAMNKAIHSLAYLFGLSQEEASPADVRPVSGSSAR